MDGVGDVADDGLRSGLEGAAQGRGTLELPLGGVIRMRPDGTGAEVYATGFRTVLNPAINAHDDLRQRGAAYAHQNA